MKNTFIVLLVVVAMASCKPKEKLPFGRNPGIEDRHWVLKEMEGKPVTFTAAQKEVSIEFENDNNFTLEAGCNTVNGMYTSQDNMIFIHQMASTKMACPELDRETTILNLLQKTNHCKLKQSKVSGVVQEQLMLMGGDTLLMKFEKGVKE
jgi:heat shock protein HslJ